MNRKERENEIKWKKYECKNSNRLYGDWDCWQRSPEDSEVSGPVKLRREEKEKEREENYTKYTPSSRSLLVAIVVLLVVVVQDGGLRGGRGEG